MKVRGSFRRFRYLAVSVAALASALLAASANWPKV
jgi:hypothetical protein